MNPESTREEQRTFLRERFLWMLMRLNNMPAEFNMFGVPPVQATFGGTDVNISSIYVKNLGTVLGVQPHALLRTSDMASFKIIKPVSLESEKDG